MQFKNSFLCPWPCEREVQVAVDGTAQCPYCASVFTCQGVEELLLSQGRFEHPCERM
jgi:hypothetical protein